MRTPDAVDVYGKEYRPAIGSFILKDDKSVGEKLLPGDDFVDSGFPGSQFRLPTGDRIIKSLAVNIVLTGRTKQRINGSYFIRCRIEYVGDCEPSSFGSGWMLAE